jgi:hypothetical protein
MIEVQNDMPRKKKVEPPVDWISAQKAADIISKRSGHTVSADYVRLLGNQSKIDTYEVNTRMKLYRLSDVQEIRVKRHERKEDK